MTRRIGLVGCVGKKTLSPARAEDLYISPLFTGRRQFVEASCDEWWILSARHGLVHPQEVLAPYEVALKNAGRSQRRAWSEGVLRSLDHRVARTYGDVIEIHAGADYRDFGLLEGLDRRGCHVVNPTEGMSIGPQLRFYKQARESSP